MPYTKGYDPDLLDDHFQRHGPLVGASDKEEYEVLADTFLGLKPCPDDVKECIRNSNQDIIRYKQSTNEFGVLSKGRVIRTFFKPNKRRHGYVSNLAYFFAECQR